MKIKYFAWCLGLLILEGHAESGKKFHYSQDASKKNAMLERRYDGASYPGGSLIEAIKYGYFDIALMEAKTKGVLAKDGPAALAYAIQQDDQQAISFLLAAGVSPNAPVEGQWFPIGEAARVGSVRSLCILMDYGMDLAKANNRVGNLQMALSGRHLDAALFLMLAGYRPSVAEANAIKIMGKKAGLEELYITILQTKSRPSSLSDLCRLR